MSFPDAISRHPSPDGDEVFVVDANHASTWIDFREIWRYRELIWIFALRDIQVRYRQTAVGVAWTLLQPLGQLFAFGVLKRMLVSESAAATVPDDLSMFCGLVLYQLFAGTVSTATQSLVDNRIMVTKVYFPRVVLPLSCCLRPLLDFCIGVGVLLLMLIWFQLAPGWQILLAPVMVLLTVIVSAGLGLWLSALNAHYRDFGFIVPYMIQLGLIISPVVYPAATVSSSWRWIYFLNPLASLLDLFRWSVLGTPLPGATDILISAFAAVALLVSGAWYFHRVDRFMADNI